MKTLAEDIENLIAQRDICRDTANQYRKAIACFSEFLKRPAKRRDLTEKNVNEWLACLLPKFSPETVRNRKGGITAVWNWLAANDQVSSYNPNKMRNIRVPEHVPSAWSLDQVRLLLSAAASVKGFLRCGLKASDMLRAWVLLAYETGLRTGDILRLTCDSIQGNQVFIVQHKTQRPHVARITDHTLEAIEPLLKLRRKHLFGFPRATARRWELHLFTQAEGLGFRRRYRQGLGTLRKTHGTEVCRISDLNAAAISLGHVSGSMIARRHYVQPDALGLPVSPPQLLGKDYDRARNQETG